MTSTTVLDQIAADERGGCVPLASVQPAASFGRNGKDVELTFFPGAPGEAGFTLDAAEAVALGKALIAAGESALDA